MDGTLKGRDRWLVPLSLWGSFLANDGEELLTMARTPLPGGRHLSQRHVTVGVSVMGTLYAAAAVEGIRTAGRGRLYQDVQLAFGAHGFGHLGAAALIRGYVSGVATSPSVVLPQWWWAASKLRRAGVQNTADPRRAVLLVGSWLMGAHALGTVAARCSR